MILIAAVLDGCGGRSSARPALDSDAATSPSGHTDSGTAPPLWMSDASASDAAPGAVSGVVVDIKTKRAVAGRIISIANHTTTTDALGRFVLDRVPASYDLLLIEPDNSTISVYKGLTRRNITIVHTPSAIRGPTPRATSIVGHVSGGGPYPVTSNDTVSVAFFSPDGDGRLTLTASSPPSGPAYQLTAQWVGPTSTSGKLVAFGTFGTGDAGDVEAGGQAVGSQLFALRDLTLAEGATASVDIALAPVSSAQIAGTVSAPLDYPLTELLEYYRFAVANSLVAGGGALTSAPSFFAVVPDLTPFGATLCVSAYHFSGLGAPTLQTEACGIAPSATDVSLTLRAPPSLLTPSDGASFATGTTFTWSPFRLGVHRLELESSLIAAGYPNVYVFTSANALDWPDLSAVGVVLPKHADYRVTVVGYAPFATMDEAFAPDGMGAVVRNVTASSSSQTVPVVTAGP